MKRVLLLVAAGSFLLSCASKNDGFDATGTFESTEVIVSSEGAGRIMELTIQEGDVVGKDQVLGVVDTVSLYLQKQQLKSSKGAIESRKQDVSKQIASTQQQIATQLIEKKRVENLIKSNAANTKQLDDIVAQIKVLEKQLTAQLSTLENNNRGVSKESSASDAQIAILDDKIARCIITSPINGTILVKYSEQGEVATIGKPLFKIADIQDMKLRAYFTSAQLSSIQLGQKVKVFSDYGGENRKQYPGEIVWISDKSEFTPKTIQTKDERENLVYAVKIAVKNDGYLKIGMYGEVQL